MKFPCLTIKQPWAGWIFNQEPLPRKHIENRTWHTRHRGWIGIHASRTRDDDNAASYLELINDRLPTPFDLVNSGYDFVTLPQCQIIGAIIGFVWLEEIGRGHASPWAMPGKSLELHYCKARDVAYPHQRSHEPLVLRVPGKHTSLPMNPKLHSVLSRLDDDFIHALIECPEYLNRSDTQAIHAAECAAASLCYLREYLESKMHGKPKATRALEDGAVRLIEAVRNLQREEELKKGRTL